MVHYSNNDKVETEKEFYDYILKYGIITEASFRSLEDDRYTKPRMKPYRDYLDKMKMKHNYSGIFQKSMVAFTLNMIQIKWTFIKLHQKH